jgi:hypothetical protein
VIYLLSLAVLRWRATGSYSLKRPFAALVIVAIGLVAGAADATALTVAVLVLVVLAVLIGIEEWDFTRPRPGGGPTKQEVFEEEHALPGEGAGG